MCTIIAKKFPDIGWVGFKNRDRAEPTSTDLLRARLNDLEKITLVDEQTHWGEGMNSHGIAVISSSLTPTTNGPVHDSYSKNGEKIREALNESTLDKVVESLQDSKVTGCVLIFDKDECFLIEGQNVTHQQVIKTITNDCIARTNHGIWLPKAGYQPHNAETELTLRRLSSEARLDIANYISQTTKSPEKTLALLAKKWSDNPQFNNLRLPTDLIDSRTTEQLMLIPSKLEIFVRNTDGVLNFTQKDANPTGSDILVGIIHRV